ncbi:MAG: hypothetical protein KJO07_13055 [Deltaproteobacteria bacterium]|nr:hypothetical protein [Deltaproteobacteria bacterium]
MTKLKALLIASVMVSMGASDAFAGRGAARGTRTNTAQQSQQRQARTRTRVRTPQRQQRTQASSRAKVEVAMYKQVMNNAIAQKATPPFFLVANKDGVKMTQTRQGNYKKNVTPAYKVDGLSKSGDFSVTALLPVSAHTGQAQQFAKSNKYNITVTHADGTVQKINKISSTGLVTEKALNLKLKPGKTVVNMWPDGSAGVAGFKAGREIELNWSGN